MCKIKEFHVKINSYGFRDYEYSFEKPENVIRIACIGDSNTFGFGVELEESWPKILEKELNKNNKNKNIKYEVLNFGVPGYGLEQYIENIKEKAINYNPDIIIIGLSSDDFLTAQDSVTINKKVYSENIKRQDILEYKYNKSEEEKDILRDKYLPAINKSFIELNNLSAENKIKIVIVTLNKQVDWLREYINSILEYYSKESSWCLVNAIVDNSFEDKTTYTFYPLDGHPNQRGTEFITERVYKSLLKCEIVQK
jgi:lysophospholipase L1-like esterase